EPGGDSAARCPSLGLPKDCQLTTPSEEFWKHFILQMTSGMEVIGEVRQPLALCLFFAWLVVFLCVVYGIKSSGKVAYFSATFPYVILIVLIVRGATLPGAYKGVIFYLKPDFSHLLKPQAWVDAASQIFFSLSCGLGGLIVFGSYNKFNNNCQRFVFQTLVQVTVDAIIVSTINCFTSFIGGFATFTVLGFVSTTLGKEVEDVISSGPGLAFVVYPESIAQMPISPLWAILFFVMLFLLGIDSQASPRHFTSPPITRGIFFVFIETIVSCMADEFKIVKRHRTIFLVSICCIGYLLGLTCITQGGIYVFNIMDRQSGGLSLIFVSIFECIVVAWCYGKIFPLGADRFCDNIEEMIGQRPNLYFRLCWKYISPLIVTLIFIWSLVSWTGLSFEGYNYPLSGDLIGWGLCLSSILCIPGYAFWHLTRSHGTLRSRIKLGFTSPSSAKDIQKTCHFSRPHDVIINIPTFIDLLPTSSVGEIYATEKVKIQLPKRINSVPEDLRKAAILHSMKIHVESLV
ncbi:hypothetical protein QZH41_012237, partial [Actinostola sp. cb2023]